MAFYHIIRISRYTLTLTCAHYCLLFSSSIVPSIGASSLTAAGLASLKQLGRLKVLTVLHVPLNNESLRSLSTLSSSLCRLRMSKPRPIAEASEVNNPNSRSSMMVVKYKDMGTIDIGILQSLIDNHCLIEIS